MSTTFTRGISVLALMALAALPLACENDLLQTAPAESSLNVSASPAVIVLNPNIPGAPVDPETLELMGSCTVTAQVITTEGYPVEDVAVYFYTTGGRLGSQGPPGAPLTPVMTDVNGFAIDSLTVVESSPASITVTARSGSLSGTAAVTRTFADCSNTAPVANAGADKTETADVLGTIVTLSATATTDAETARDDLLFVWDCGNGTTGVPTDTGPWEVECEYADVGVFTAKVTVTDDGNGPGDTRCILSDTDEVIVTIEE